MKDGTETYWRRSTFKIGEGQLRFFANKKPIRNHRVNKSPFLPDTRYGLRAIWVFRTMKKDYAPEKSALRLLDALMQTVPCIVSEDVHF